MLEILFGIKYCIDSSIIGINDINIRDFKKKFFDTGFSYKALKKSTPKTKYSTKWINLSY